MEIPEFPGIVWELLVNGSRKNPARFQIYFTGCGGNVTVGKHNDGNRQSREQLAFRLYDAMRRGDSVTRSVIESAKQSEDQLAERVLEVDVLQLASADIDWALAPIRFTVREDGAFNPDLLRKQLAVDQPFSVRLTAAMFSGFGQRLRDGYVAQQLGCASAISISCICLGSHLLSFNCSLRISQPREPSPAWPDTVSAAFGIMAPIPFLLIAVDMNKLVSDWTVSGVSRVCNPRIVETLGTLNGSQDQVSSLLSEARWWFCGDHLLESIRGDNSFFLR